MRNRNYFIKSFSWGVIAKVSDAVVKFFTFPMLLILYGKENFGVMTLALSMNAYMLLLDMGMNIGGIKFFSQWLANKKYDLVDSVARTSISFYMIIGLINSILLILLAVWGEHIFNISSTQFDLLKVLLLIISVFSILNWGTTVFNQLLVANENISIVQKILLGKSIVNLVLVLITVDQGLSIEIYFLLFIMLNALIFIPTYYIVRSKNLITSIIPAGDWSNFGIIFRYSMSIFLLTIFQFSAYQTRPIVLGIFTNQGADVLTDYRIIEVFPVFIITLGGLLISILLPITSKFIQDNNTKQLKKMAYKGTSYTSIIVSFLCFPIILNASDIIELYVGKEYIHLSKWLILWVFTVLLYLHNSPVSSMVLATGKTKELIYATAIASVLSIIINAFLCPYFEVGSAVIGYSIYILIQISFYYFYFNNKILKLNSWIIFKSFSFPAIFGILSMAPFFLFNLNYIGIVNILIKTMFWAFIYSALLLLTGIIKIKEIKQLVHHN